MSVKDTPPKVSVLTCVYNGERFLREAVQSILDQTFRDFEYIIVDDGSTDGTAKILEELAAEDSRVMPVSKPHSGISESVNLGLTKCRGEYVARIDADDTSPPYRLQEQADYLDGAPDAVLIGGQAQTMDADGNLGSTTNAGRHTKTNLNMFPPKVALSMQGLCMVRRQALVGCGGYRKALDLAEDYDLFLRLYRYGRFYNPDRIMLHYRQHDGSMSRTRTVLQEKYAAFAEISAIEVHEGRPDPVESGPPETAEERILACIDQRLLDAYIRFRVWRRGIAPADRRDEFSTARVLLDVFSVHPSTLFSPKYHYLRYRMLAGVVRVRGLNLLTKLRARKPGGGHCAAETP